MMNISDSAIKIVIPNKRKWLNDAWAKKAKKISCPVYKYGHVVNKIFRSIAGI
jgi:hypothetical protein